MQTLLTSTMVTCMLPDVQVVWIVVQCVPCVLLSQLLPYYMYVFCSDAQTGAGTSTRAVSRGGSTSTTRSGAASRRSGSSDSAQQQQQHYSGL